MCKQHIFCRQCRVTHVQIPNLFYKGLVQIKPSSIGILLLSQDNHGMSSHRVTLPQVLSHQGLPMNLKFGNARGELLGGTDVHQGGEFFHNFEGNYGSFTVQSTLSIVSLQISSSLSSYWTL